MGVACFSLAEDNSFISHLIWLFTIDVRYVIIFQDFQDFKIIIRCLIQAMYILCTCFPFALLSMVILSSASKGSLSNFGCLDTLFLLGDIEVETLRQWVLEGHKIDDVVRMYTEKFQTPMRWASIAAKELLFIVWVFISDWVIAFGSSSVSAEDYGCFKKNIFVSWVKRLFFVYILKVLNSCKQRVVLLINIAWVEIFVRQPSTLKARKKWSCV